MSSTSSNDENGSSINDTTSITSKCNNSNDSVITNWKKQLITKEDPGHVHKVLGILCLLSYIWRIINIGENDMGFKNYPKLTIPTIILHWLLTLSSFIFNIPKKRIKTGDRIWPEYRLHALVFLSRSLAIMCVYYYEQIYNLQPNYDMNFIIVIITLVAADISSWSVGTNNQSGSIRDLDTHPAIKFYFSVFQFGATSGCLYGLRRYSLMFYMSFIVQLNPFMMTLRRKNLVNKSFILFLYGIGISLGVWLVLYEYMNYTNNGLNAFFCQGLILNIAAILRLSPRLPVIRYIQDNKYIIWILLGLLMRYIRPIFDDELSTTMMLICQFFRFSMFSLGIWIGFFRNNNNNKQTIKSNEKTC